MNPRLLPVALPHVYHLLSGAFIVWGPLYKDTAALVEPILAFFPRFTFPFTMTFTNDDGQTEQALTKPAALNGITS